MTETRIVTGNADISSFNYTYCKQNKTEGIEPVHEASPQEGWTASELINK